MKRKVPFSIFVISLLVISMLFVSCTSEENSSSSKLDDEKQTSETTADQKPSSTVVTEPEEDTQNSGSVSPSEQEQDDTGSTPVSDSTVSQDDTTVEEQELPVIEETGPPGKLVLEQEVSPEIGANLTVDNGRMTIEFPANSVTENTTIEVRVLSESEIPEEARALNPLGDIYNFGPDGLQLNEPAKLTITYQPEEIAALELPEGNYPVLLALIRDADGMWDITGDVTTQVNVQTCAATVSTSISHFSELYVTDAIGIKVSMEPTLFIGYVQDIWEVTLSLTNDGTSEDFAVADPIESTAQPFEIVGPFGNPLHNDTAVPGGNTTTVTPNPRFICRKIGDGTFGFSIGIDVRDMAEKVLGVLFGAKLNKEGIKNNVWKAWYELKGDCECGAVPTTDTPSTSPPSPPCFAGDTLVLMYDGSVKYIKDIQAGEKVKAYDTRLSTVVTGHVISTNNGKADYYYVINDELKVTPPHPFYTVQGEWVKIEELKIGDEIMTISGKLVINSIQKIHDDIRIFNIAVGEYNNFFVSGDGQNFYLVHQGE